MTPEAEPSQRVDGRSEHKSQTRQSLIDAALELFAAKGYDATSTEEIAERAGVSPRTFFRYFETKDRVLFFGGDAFNSAIVRELPRQPFELDDFAALEATIISLCPLVVPLKKRISLYFRALQTSTALVGQHAQDSAKHNTAVAQALAARRSLAQADERCQVTASLAGLAMDRAYQSWLQSKGDLTEVTAQSFELIRGIVAGERTVRLAHRKLV
ncbi:TetR/AcrR family transcriptional regulator [Jatrophihabitans sp. DSM 45814]